MRYTVCVGHGCLSICAGLPAYIGGANSKAAFNINLRGLRYWQGRDAKRQVVSHDYTTHATPQSAITTVTLMPTSCVEFA